MYIDKQSEFFQKKLSIPNKRTCGCPQNKLNCLTAKEWMKSMVGLWEFSYEGRDVRDKSVHPASFPIALAQRVISLFTHEGECVLDPFCGTGTTLIAANDLKRNAVGFDLKNDYAQFANKRIENEKGLFDDETTQCVIHDNAINACRYLSQEQVSLLLTSPPYANMLNQKKKNKSRRNRKNDQYGKVEQYSQDEQDLGTMEPEVFIETMGDIFESFLPFLKDGAHCVINITDIWTKECRIPLHAMLIEEMKKRGYVFRNTIIWDRRKLVNGAGIFGWPSNYITMGATFEYILDFTKKGENQ